LNDIPQAVLSEHFEERMRGRRLIAAVFTTYQFDPGFFEKEILPVFLDIQLSHVPSLRLLQLERALPSVFGGVAVYYDTDGLISRESPCLDFCRYPIRYLQGRRRQGVFHAKCVFLLVESKEEDETGSRPKALLVATPSANLTESGWWSNVEVCHVEEIAEKDATRIKDDLVWFLRWLRDHTSLGPDGKQEESARKPVQSILDFLSGTEQRAYRSSGEGLYTHFFASRQSIPDFLDEIAGDRISGAYLEVISPYFDDEERCAPLLDLIERFGPKEVKVFLPRSSDGTALVKQSIYDSIKEMLNTSWGKLPADILRLGKSADVKERFVHAKVYRFFTHNPKREIYFIGSANLTRPAHQHGGNVEAGFLIELTPEHKPDWWLIRDTQLPEAFEQRSEKDEEGPVSVGTRLQLRYHWDTGQAEAFWEGDADSQRLRLEGRSCILGELGPLRRDTWTLIPEDITKRISEILKETAFVSVYGDGPDVRLLLIQEDGMEHKPSLILRLSVADILRYWSLLTSEQKAAFIESRGQELAESGEGADLIAKFKLEAEKDTLFDRFAGFFHAFACLERSIREALKENNFREASYRLFGLKYDSLGTLLKKLFESDSEHDEVERYVILICAKQLLQEIKKGFSDFWKEHKDDVACLEKLIARGNETREKLIAKMPNEMPDFLDWFDRCFLQKATPEEDRLD
jgi:hypothetical protein